MDWSPLGIAPTKDKKAIKAAYRKMLKENHPEDAPEDFMALRRAYEEALALADSAEEKPPADDTPIGRFQQEIRRIYGDFRRRIDPASWQNILESDVCLTIGLKNEAEKALLGFLLEHYYLPCEVWALFDKTFSFSLRREELYEEYPRDFVDYLLIRGAKDESVLPPGLFSPGEDAEACDAYFHLYNELNRAEKEKRPELLEKLRVLPEKHPYGETLFLIQLWNDDRQDEALSGLIRLAAAHPDDAFLQNNLAVYYNKAGQAEEAEAVLRAFLKCSPSAVQSRFLLAQLLQKKHRFLEAKKLLYSLMDDNPLRRNNEEYSTLLHKINEEMIPEYRKRLEKAPGDIETQEELAWCCIQNDMPEMALSLCEERKKQGGDTYEYHNLLGKVYYCTEHYAEAVPHLKRAIELLRELMPDGSEDRRRRIAKLPEFLELLGTSYQNSGKPELSGGCFEEALRLAPDSPQIISSGIAYYRLTLQPEKAERLARKLTELDPTNDTSHFLYARLLYDLRQDQQAFSEVNYALDQNGSEFWYYILKMRILLRNHAWNEAEELMDFLRKNGIKECSALLWGEALLARFRDNNAQQALLLCRKAETRLAKEPVDWTAELYYRLAVLTAEVDENTAPETLLALLDKGLAADENDADCLNYKAWLLNGQKKYEAALALYHKLEKLPGCAAVPVRDIADIYYRNLNRYAGEARDYYLRLPNYEDDPEILFYLGVCERYLYRFTDAEKRFLRMQSIAPEDPDGWRGLAQVCLWDHRPGEALEQIELYEQKLRENGREPGLWDADQHIRALQRLGRADEALAEAELLSRFENSRPFDKKFEILTQFGRFAEAEALVREEKKRRAEKENCREKEAFLALYTDDIKSARRQLRSITHPSDDLTAYILRSLGKAELLVHHWQSVIRRKGKNSYIAGNMAEALFLAGRKTEAREWAEEVLLLAESEAAQNRSHAALYASRRANALSLLGRFEEAKEELARTRALPLCETCAYSCCKDADFFEAVLYDRMGNIQKAEALYQKGCENWPDEPGFRIGLNQLKGKESRHDDRH